MHQTGRPPTATLALEQDFERATGGRIDRIDLGRAGAFLALDIVRGERLFCRSTHYWQPAVEYQGDARPASDRLPFAR